MTGKFSGIKLLTVFDSSINGTSVASNQAGQGIRNVNILVPETTIGIFTLWNCHPLERPIVLISVRSIEQTIQKYYVNSSQQTNQQQKSTKQISMHSD